jgi:ABC-type lipoprotein export system ATPase subunit
MSLQSRLVAVPRLTGPAVQRTALLRRLESAGELLVLVVAPSGVGKTSLLTHWAIDDGRAGCHRFAEVALFKGTQADRELREADVSVAHTGGHARR